MGKTCSTWSRRRHIFTYRRSKYRDGRTAGSIEDADINGDCVIDAFDKGEIKDFYEKGFGPKFNPGFEKVDYDRDGIIYLDEVSMNKHDANDRCAGNEDYACTRCDDVLNGIPDCIP